MAAEKNKKAAVSVPSTNEEKQKALAMALSGIEKQFGKGALMKLGESQVMDIQVIPTGCMELDMALGVGGVPRGRVVEIYGPESSLELAQGSWL